jgi:hypothetical protein
MANKGRHTAEEVAVPPVAARASTTHNPFSLLLEGAIRTVMGGAGGGQRQHQPVGRRSEDRATPSMPAS